MNKSVQERIAEIDRELRWWMLALAVMVVGVSAALILDL